MDQINSLMQSIVNSIAEKAIKSMEVELNIVSDLGPARAFFIQDCPFGDRARVAVVSEDSYQIAKAISTKFIFYHQSVNSERRILFSTHMKEPVSPGVNKFILLDKNGKYILLHKYNLGPDAGLIYEYQKEIQKRDSVIRSLEDKIDYLTEDIRDITYNLKTITRKLDDLTRDKRY